MCLVLWFFLTLLVKSLFKKPLTRKNPLNLPPSPPSLPIIGHLHLLGPSLYKSLHNLSTKYGPLLYLCIGASRCLLVSTSSMATKIFKTNDLAFAYRPHFTFVDKLPYGNWIFHGTLCWLLAIRQKTLDDRTSLNPKDWRVTWCTTRRNCIVST